MKKHLVMILVMLLLSAAICGLPAGAEENSGGGLKKDVKILYTSDVHCAVDEGWGYGGICAAKQSLAGKYHVLLVDDGDAVQGQPIGLMTRGEAIIDIMNATGYDIAIPGNHEFDYGMDVFQNLAKRAEFPYISCNFNKEGEPVFPAYVIKEFDGVKIAFVGVTTPMTIRDSAPEYFMDDKGNYIYGFSQDETGDGVCQAVQSAVDSAREEGAEYVVVMAHMGNEAEVSPWMYTDVISHTTGIDAWLDGHSHDAEQVVMKNKNGQDVYRSACGTKNKNIGVLTISADGTISTELFGWSAGIPAPELLGLSNPATRKVAEAEKLLDTRIAISGSDPNGTLGSDPETETESEAVVSSGDYDYLINNNTAVIIGYTGDADTVTLPSEINEYQVTGIEAEAFRYRKFKSVSIPGSIRSIGRQAFEYCEITDSLQLPKNVEISEDAFSYAVLPSVVTIPAGAVAEKCAFSYCGEVKQICIDPDAVIKSRAFGYCDDLKLVVCAGGSRLEAKAFEYCRGMEKAFLCGDVDIEEDAFNNCGEAELEKAAPEEYDTLKQSAPGEPVDTAPYETEERVLEIKGSPAGLDGVTVTLESASAQRLTDPDRYEYSFTGTIENDTDEGIMQVIYTFALLDENGEEFRSFGEVYDGEDTAIPPHTMIEFTHDGIKWGPQSTPSAVEIGISSVETESDLPPAHMPKKGEYLYQALGDEKLANIKEEPPVELSFHVDQGGYGRTATFREGEPLEKAIELLCAIRIGEESGEWVTDNYNGIGLRWADGSYTGISLNLRNLEYWVHSTIHTYELESLSEFWSYCADYLEEDAA